jgi:hypothetical protein
MVQTPESAIEAVLNPNDLRASRGQVMVQFAAKRWFKSHSAAALGDERSAAEGCTKRSEEEWRKPGETRVEAGGPSSEALPELAG